jgi:prepilin-type processing-associated H-X9-DG protein
MMSLLTELENSGECFSTKISPLTGLGKLHLAAKATALFCDGHVESPTLQFLFADISDAALEQRSG